MISLPPKIKRIVLDPHPALRAKNVEVTDPWEYLEASVRRMFKLMYEAGNGVGLSAPQVGWNVRLFIMNTNGDKGHDRKTERVFWNPSIVEVDGGIYRPREGCLSLPGVFGLVNRYKRVRMAAITPAGVIDQWFEDFVGQIVQHEVCHMRGVLCWERFEKDEA